MPFRPVLLRALLPLCVLWSFGQRAEPPAHLVVISLDGLMPSAYTTPDAAVTLPVLSRLAREGAYAEGVVGVLP